MQLVYHILILLAPWLPLALCRALLPKPFRYEPPRAPELLENVVE